MAGRPTKKTAAMLEDICHQIAIGKSLRRIVEAPGMPGLRTVMTWLNEDTQFQQQYARAREAQADLYADEIIEIADDASKDDYDPNDGTAKVNHNHIQRDRLRVDARKWKASQLAPKKWGQQNVQNTITGADNGPVRFVVEVVSPKDKE